MLENDFDLQPVFVFENPVAVKILSRYMMQQLNVDKEACLQILEHGRNSFISIFATLERRLQIDIPSDTRQELVDQINAEMNEVEKRHILKNILLFSFKKNYRLVTFSI